MIPSNLQNPIHPNMTLGEFLHCFPELSKFLDDLLRLAQEAHGLEVDSTTGLQSISANGKQTIRLDPTFLPSAPTVASGSWPAPYIYGASLVAGGSLTVGTTYYYRVVCAQNLSGGGTYITSLASNEVSFTPTTGNQSVNLVWYNPFNNFPGLANDSGHYAGYSIYAAQKNYSYIVLRYTSPSGYLDGTITNVLSETSQTSSKEIYNTSSAASGSNNWTFTDTGAAYTGNTYIVPPPSGASGGLISSVNSSLFYTSLYAIPFQQVIEPPTAFAGGITVCSSGQGSIGPLQYGLTVVDAGYNTVNGYAQLSNQAINFMTNTSGVPGYITISPLITSPGSATYPALHIGNGSSNAPLYVEGYINCGAAFGFVIGTYYGATGTDPVGNVIKGGIVTTIGTGLASSSITWPSQTANTFFAAPNGSSGTPSFRTIASADLPVCSSTVLGAAKVDNTSIKAVSGVVQGGGVSGTYTSGGTTLTFTKGVLTSTSGTGFA